MDIAAIKGILKEDINYYWILLSAFIGFLSHVVRAVRWKIQIKALPSNPPLKVLTNAVFGTYAINLLLPRVGEVWRCGYVAHHENLSFIKVVGSMISERLSDTATVAMLTLTLLIVQMPFIREFLDKYPALMESINNTITSPYPYIVCVVAVVALVLVMKRNTQNRLIIKLKEFVLNLWRGVKTILTMDKKWLFILYTLLMWGLYFLELYVCFFAFEATTSLGILCAYTAFILGSISMGLPVQGGLGPWHWTVIGLLTIYGVDANTAGAFALVAHGVQMVLMILLGIYTFISISAEKRSLKVETPLKG